MKRYLNLLSVFAILFLSGLASAQLVPGPSHPKPPPYTPPPPPYYPPAPNPPYSGGCSYDVCTGDTVINIQRDYRRAVVVGIESTGTFVLRFIDNGGVGGNWGRQDLALTHGCFNRVCVNDRVFNTKRDYRMTQVVGIQSNGLYVIQFLDNNGVGGNWANTDLAYPYGCGRQFCVNDFALNIQKNYRKVQIVGIEFYGTYVVRFLDNNGIGGNWNDADLVRTNP